MINLLTFIYEQIAMTYTRVYFEKAPQDTIYPYVVYHLPNISEVEVREDIVLEVDIWTNNANTVELETITENVDKKLNRLSNIDDNFFIKIYRDSPYRLTIPDQDPIIDRRRLRYNIKLYRRG